jgi:hypothetical protein
MGLKWVFWFENMPSGNPGISCGFPTKIEEHGDEDDDAEPDVELDGEIGDGDQDVDEGRHDGEDDVVQLESIL